MVAVRMSEEEVAAIDAMCERMGKRNLGGSPPPRAEVVRIALPRGLESMHAELDREEKKTRKRK